MNKSNFRNTFIYLLPALCLHLSGMLHTKAQNFKIKFDTLNLYDQSRNRSIPVALYLPETTATLQQQKLVIFSHGYNANKPGSNLGYSFITRDLASRGYFVASIQHELPADSLIPNTGIPQVVRRTNWERGVENILFVLNELKKSNPRLDFQHVILIGHSNGGDMSMLFAQKYPAMADKIISLDNRRVTFPRTNHPKIYSLRSSDQQADEGVLPTAAEQQQYGMKIIQLQNTLHNDMGDNASKKQRKKINNYILDFLRDR